MEYGSRGAECRRSDASRIRHGETVRLAAPWRHVWKHMRKILIALAVIAALSFAWRKYFKYRTSDAYAESMLNHGDCLWIAFSDGSWLKLLSIDTRLLFPVHCSGAMYLLDSQGRLMKIQGGTIKPRRVIYPEIAHGLLKCKSADEALTNNVWRDVFPWCRRLPVEFFVGEIGDGL